MTGGHGGNSMAQTGFRGRNDDGDETTATWIAPLNTVIEMRVDRIFRVRLLCEANGLFLGTHHLYQSPNPGGGGGTQVTNSSNPLRTTLSPNYPDAQATTQQLGSGTFTPGNPGMANNTPATSPISYPANGEVGDLEEAEVEYAVTITGIGISDGDPIYLHAQFGAAAFSRGYFEVAKIIVNMPRTIRRTLFIT